jgi:DNA replication protein DnaC
VAENRAGMSLPPHLARLAAGAEAPAAPVMAPVARVGVRTLGAGGARVAGEPLFPCPCACACGNDTTMPARKVDGSSSARYLRCDPCSAAGGVHSARGPVKTDVPAPAGLGVKPFRAQVSAQEAEWDRQAAEEQARVLFEKERPLWRESLPEKFRDACLDDLVDPANAAAIEERLALIAEGRSGGAIIAGPMEGGKTYLGYALCNLAFERGLVKRGQIKFGTEAQLLGGIAVAPWNERDRLLKELLSPRLRILFIDDMGREMQMKAADRRSLYDQIADRMWANGRSLIVTSNLLPGPPPTPDDDSFIAGWVGAAAYSRIATSSGSNTIRVAERGMRRKLWVQQQAERRAGQ